MIRRMQKAGGWPREGAKQRSAIQVLDNQKTGWMTDGFRIISEEPNAADDSGRIQASVRRSRNNGKDGA